MDHYYLSVSSFIAMTMGVNSDFMDIINTFADYSLQIMMIMIMAGT